jgi:hypothetical protein
MFETRHIKHLLAAILICLIVLCTQFASVNADELMQLSNDNGTAEYYHTWQAGDMVGAVLTPNPDWSYPIQVDSVEVLLYQFPGAASSATVRAHVYSTINGEPGVLLGSSAPTIITTFWSTWASISLASAKVTLSSPDPFMVAIEYTAGASGSIPSMLTDSQNDIASGRNFYSRDSGATWYEHYDFWVEPEDVGYNMIRVTVDVMPDTAEWKIYLPGIAKNWSPPTPTPTPTPPPPPDLPCLYALNWWRNDSWPYDIIRSSYSPPCLMATVDVEHIYDGTGRQLGYRAAVERQDKLDFDMDATYVFNSSNGVEGANVIKTYVGGYQYQMEITQFCPRVGQLTGYKVKVYAPPYNGQEVTVGICP